MKTDRDLTRGPLFRQIVSFSVPLMATNVLQVLFNMSDIAVVGRFAGERGPAALGAVGSTTQMITLFTGFLIGLGGGVNVLTARALGARDNRGVLQIVHTAFVTALAMGAALFGLGELFGRPLLALLRTRPDLIDGAELYLRIVAAGLPAMAVYNAGSAVLSAEGDTRRPLLFLSLSGVLNVLLNVLFVVGFGMDVAGVALATVLSQYVSAGLIVFSLLRDTGSVSLRGLSRRTLSARCAGKILALGIPAGLQNSVFAVANMFIQSGVNSLDTVIVEGNAAAANADGLLYDMMAAVYTACASFMGQCLGAGDRARARKAYLYTTALSFGLAAVLSGLLLAGGRLFLSLFTADASVVEAGLERLQVMCLSYAVSAFMDNSIAASRALGKSLMPMLLVFLGSCVFRVVWVLTVFAHFGTLRSLYLVYIVSWVLTGTAEVLYFVRCWRRLDSSRRGLTTAESGV